jgi:hypothetical protein
MRHFCLRSRALVYALVFGFILMVSAVWGQETTGGMQGTVKDPSGAVVPGAMVTVATPTLVGTKLTTTDAAGYYRLANLPPGVYTITVKAEGFDTLERKGVSLEVGHLPTIDLVLSVGAVNTVVEVKTEGPLIDETTTTTLTNIPEQALQNLPHGTSFQSVIQFAPSARNEPLAGSTAISNGTGSVSPGNGSNGGSIGYSIGGGADSENSYLVEGQETANIIGGYSHTNVPMDFIQEVEMKTSGVEAEYGGALGGVVNVIMDKGTSKWHGSVFTNFQDGAMNGSPNAYPRYDIDSSGTSTSWGYIDPDYQNYQPTRPHTSDFWPGFTVGGPLMGIVPKLPGSDRLKDRIFLFAGFAPEFNAYEIKVDMTNGGLTPFSQNTHTFYTYGRVDAEVTQKIRVFGSYLYQAQRQYGESLPHADSVQGYTNPSAGNAISNYAHTIGYTAPNITLNTGADITLTNSLVSTSRFGYYFENYHDFGYPESGTIDDFQDTGTGNTDTQGNALPSALQQTSGYTNLSVDGSFTHRNSNKAIQFDQDISWFHAGLGGTHNIKFGYQLHRNSNDILQGFNTAYMQVWPGTTNPYSPISSTGKANCAAVEAANLQNSPSAAYTANPSCVGQYGTVDVYDFGSGGRATAYNHGFYGQDAWTIGKGLTLNYGLRIEHEYLPAENQPSNTKITQPIDFGWGDKIAPRVGAAWDVYRNGKMKVFGGYGQFYDQMKLNVAISSYGGQYWQECWYALNTPALSGLNPAYNAAGRDCSGYGANNQANWGGSAPSGLTFLENQNLRAWPTTCSTCSIAQEGTAPGLKPYQQHESNLGVDYQIRPNLALEARWDRRRLDHVIEDSSIFSPAAGGETFVIVNPGQGVNDSFNDFYTFIYGTAPDCSLGCPTGSTIPAARSYDGVEFRLTKAQSRNWAGMFSYTYSHFRGNYTGLTSTDVADGGGGRNAPDNSRAFDEPFFSWNANGGSSSGLLPTDRPNALKGYVYYEVPWMHKFATDFGIFQDAYSGTPLSSYIDVGYAYASGDAVPPSGAFPTQIVDRGKWIDVQQNAATGQITVGTPYTKRTPWYTQTDFDVKQSYKISERSTLSLSATFTNLLNQHSVVSENQEIDSAFATNFITPSSSGCGTFNANNYNIPSNSCWLPDGPVAYAAYHNKYDYVGAMNASDLGSAGGGPITTSSQYGKPYLYQIARNVRLAVHITF